MAAGATLRSRTIAAGLCTALDTMPATVDRRDRLDAAIAELAADSAHTPLEHPVGVSARRLDVDRVRRGGRDR